MSVFLRRLAERNPDSRNRMGTYGVGDLALTKPYVSGAGYIDRMSDYCGRCRFDPATTCPITPLFWAFLDRRPPLKRLRDREVFATAKTKLQAGEELRPEDFGAELGV